MKIKCKTESDFAVNGPLQDIYIYIYQCHPYIPIIVALVGITLYLQKHNMPRNIPKTVRK